MPITASVTAPVPMVPARNFFLLPFRSARLPRNGMSNASTREATVEAYPQATTAEEFGSAIAEK